MPGEFLQIGEKKIEIRDLPTIPSVHNKILKIIEDINYSVEEVSGLIEKDHVLSSKVLKLVNSPSYGLNNKVASVRRGVILLGANLIRGIILSTSLFKGSGEEMPGIWDHSYCTSAIAGLLARRYNLITIEELMTGALLHDIGRVLLYRYLKEEMVYLNDIVATKKINMLEAERLILGKGHDEIGWWLAKVWNFPPIIEDIIRFHHAPSEAENNVKAVSIVHLSNIMSKAIGITYGSDPYIAPFDPVCLTVMDSLEFDITDIASDAVEMVESDSALKIYIEEPANG
ncbi:MAG: HDOD domain-containing protein [Dissulfurispiraceae bacterium]|jgi:putative nucleotidyltransferase with HDIG domain|nr:HDOD domain-containing protein [Dissulfurispiraceae bacterium]